MDSTYKFLLSKVKNKLVRLKNSVVQMIHTFWCHNVPKRTIRPYIMAMHYNMTRIRTWMYRNPFLVESGKLVAISALILAVVSHI